MKVVAYKTPQIMENVNERYSIIVHSQADLGDEPNCGKYKFMVGSLCFDVKSARLLADTLMQAVDWIESRTGSKEFLVK